MKALLLAMSLTVLGSGLSSAMVQRPDDLDAIRKYKTWHKLTEQPVEMDRAIAVSCAGPTISDQAPNPHVQAVFNVYVNPTAAKAMLSKVPVTYPEGSIIVKEKFTRPEGKTFEFKPIPKDAKPSLFTVMIKRTKGFSPETGDWQYMVLSGDMRSVESKGLEKCAKCHQTVAKGDYVFGNYGTLGRPSH